MKSRYKCNTRSITSALSTLTWSSSYLTHNWTQQYLKEYFLNVTIFLRWGNAASCQLAYAHKSTPRTRAVPGAHPHLLVLVRRGLKLLPLASGWHSSIRNLGTRPVGDLTTPLTSLECNLLCGKGTRIIPVWLLQNFKQDFSCLPMSIAKCQLTNLIIYIIIDFTQVIKETIPKVH